MKRIILHIGPHKTASSYLQKELSDNYNSLKTHNILYPKKWRDFLWGHHTLVTDVITCGKYETNNIEKIQDYFKEELKKYDTIVISSENLEYWSEQEIESFSSLSNIAEVNIVYYVRKISGLSYSSWQENIKHGSVELFSEFMYKHYSYPFKSNIFNYVNILNKFKSNLPHSIMHIIIYDNLLEDNIDIAEHFFEKILNQSWFKKKKTEKDRKVNVAISPLHVEIIRALNLHYKLEGVNVNDNIRNKFLKNIEYYTHEVEALELDSQNLVTNFDVNDSSHIPSTIYSNLYEKYFNSILNHSEGKLFHKPTKKNYQIISPNIWFKSANIDYLNKIIEILHSLDKKLRR